MTDSILFEVPLTFEAGLKAGSIERIGTLLKDSGTGRILDHVQETRLDSRLHCGSERYRTIRLAH